MFATWYFCNRWVFCSHLNVVLSDLAQNGRHASGAGIGFQYPPLLHGCWGSLSKICLEIPRVFPSDWLNSWPNSGVGHNNESNYFFQGFPNRFSLFVLLRSVRLSHASMALYPECSRVIYSLPVMRCAVSFPFPYHLGNTILSYELCWMCSESCLHHLLASFEASALWMLKCDDEWILIRGGVAK